MRVSWSCYLLPLLPSVLAQAYGADEDTCAAALPAAYPDAVIESSTASTAAAAATVTAIPDSSSNTTSSSDSSSNILGDTSSTNSTNRSSTTPANPSTNSTTTASNSTDTIPFTLMALHSGSPIHLSTVNASNGALWIGRNTSTYCPPSSSSADLSPAMAAAAGVNTSTNCSALTANTTVLAGGGNGLYVRVPGGQTLYSTSNGTLGYTRPHSVARPEGVLVAWGNFLALAEGRSYGCWSWGGSATGGLLACPSGEEDGAYRIAAVVNGTAGPAGCIGFQAAATPWTGAPAWEYS